MSDHPHSSQRKPRNWPSVAGTPEQRASKGLSRLEDITRLISEWVWEADVEGRLTYASERVTEVLGWIPIQINGKTFFELGRFVNEDGGEITPDLEKPFRELLFEAKTRTGDDRLLQVSGLPFYDKDTWSIEGYCGTAEDITDQRHALNEMRLAKREAETANLAKSDFLSSMSHELRTPLNAILGFAQLLDYNPKEPLTPNQKGSIDQITKGGKHLLELINDVLDLAQIESGKLDLSIVDVDAEALIDECMPLAEALAQQRYISVEVSKIPGKILRADVTRLKQVLLNLISNAVKYNCEEGVVAVECCVVPNSMLRISVIDTGEGIPLEDQKNLFRPFFRLGAEDTKIEGTGIGLVITKRLIEAMGGRIGFESVPGEGSTFWIEAPLSETLSAEEGNATVADEAVSPVVPEIHGKIVYIEDNPANIALMQSVLGLIAGIDLQVAHNAELGLALVKKNKPNLILMDINLPGMNGIEALGKLRADPETCDIPTIAISAAAMPDDVEKGLKAGFLAYMTKPFNIPEMLKTIEGALKT